jgi:hypothetical protein
MLWSASVRLAVAALCVALVLSLAQLTIDGLLAAYLHIAPYSGLG